MIIQLIDNSGMIYTKGTETAIENLYLLNKDDNYPPVVVKSIEKNLENFSYFVNCSRKTNNGTEEKFRLTIFQPISILEKIDQGVVDS